MLEWAYHGVNISVPRNGGKECSEFLSMKQRLIETAVVLLVTLPLLHSSLRSVSPLKHLDYSRQKEPLGKRILLVLLCLIWGVEIGFKFSSRAVIFLLNPCHVTTALQIYLLAAPPSKTSSALFRFHLNCMNGPILALAFPELDALNERMNLKS